MEQIDTYFAKYLPQLFYSLLAPVTLFCLLYTSCGMDACSFYKIEPSQSLLRNASSPEGESF